MLYVIIPGLYANLHIYDLTVSTRLERAALETIAHHLNEEEIGQLRKVFVAMDR